MIKILKRLLQISRQNVFRNKRRTLLTLSILTLGSTGLVLIGGFFGGMAESFREQYIHSQTGHIMINAEGYNAKGVSAPFEYLLRQTSRVRSIVTSDPHVLFTVPTLKFGGMASTDKTGMAVIAIGVDPDGEKRMGQHKYAAKIQRDNQTLSTNIIEGRGLDANDPEGVILGKGLLDSLGLKVGDPFTLITTREGGSIDGSQYKVRGVFQTVMKDFDDRGLKMNITAAQKVLGFTDEVHSLLVLLDDTKNTDSSIERIGRTLQQEGLKTELISWEQNGHMYRNAKLLFDKIEKTVNVIIAIVFFFSIANTINMAIFERMREFGTMMAIGNNRSIVFSVIFLEALFLGLLGAALGAVIGCGLAGVISSFGITLPPLPNSTLPYTTNILVDGSMIFRTFLLAFLSTTFASLLPAWRASHLKIVDALGYV
jgi:putative ABC transport system permease protein